MAATRFRRRVRAPGEGGFSIVEVMVASGVMLAALVLLAHSSTVAFADIALARQRQAATGLANMAIEQVRALPFDLVKRGMRDTDVASGTDPAITACQSGNRCYNGELLTTAAIPPTETVPPIVPYRATRAVGVTSYTVAVYVTHYLNDITNGTYRVTAHVGWARAARGGVRRSVTTSTLLHAGQGCASTATHPFGAPCQPFLYATAAARRGGVDVSGTLGGRALRRASLELPEHASVLQLEQIGSVYGFARTSGVSLDVDGMPPASAGGQQVAARADNDPSAASSGETQIAEADPILQPITNVSTGSGPAQLVLTSSGGDTARVASTAVARASTNCADPSSVPQDDRLPCGDSSFRQALAQVATLDLDGAASKAVLASVAAVPTAAKAHTNRALVPEASACTGASGDGCVRAHGTRPIGLVRLGGLPTDFAVPVGWTGALVELDSYGDAAIAESGTGTLAPSVSRSGVVRYWNGAGYTVLPLVPGAATVLPVTPVGITDALTGRRVEMTATLEVGATELVDPAGAGCAWPCTRTAAEARVNSPLMGRITYKVWNTITGASIADLTIAVDLGALHAVTSYKAAPSGL